MASAETPSRTQSTDVYTPEEQELAQVDDKQLDAVSVVPLEPLWKRVVTNLAFQVAVAAFIGIGIGIIMSQFNAPNWVVSWFKLPGTLFIDLLKCVVLPMLFVNIFIVSADMMGGSNGHGSALGLGWRTIVLYLIGSLFAALQALLWTLFFSHLNLIKLSPSAVSYKKPTVHIGCPAMPQQPNPDGTTTTSTAAEEGQYLARGNVAEAKLWGAPLGCKPIPAINDAVWEQMNTTVRKNANPEFLFEVDEQSKYLIGNEDRLKAMNANVSISDQLINGVFKDLIPANLVGAFASNNFLGLIFLAVFLAYAAATMDEKPTLLLKFARQVNDLFQRSLATLMVITPVAVFFLCAGSFGERPNLGDLFGQLGALVAVSLLAMFSHTAIFLPLQYLLLARGNPFTHIRAFFPAQAIAFSAGSSAAALPVNKRCADQRGGIAPHVRDFVLSIGATINMDGSAIYITTVTIFLGVQNNLLSENAIGKYVMTVILATLGSAGSAPVPSFGLVMIVICFNTVYGETGTPDAFALIISINWFMDRFMTLVNVSGDAFSVGIMARWDNMVRANLKGDLSSTSSKAVSEDAAKKNSLSV